MLLLPNRTSRRLTLSLIVYKLLRTLLPIIVVGVLASVAQSCAHRGSADVIEFATRTDSVGYVMPDLHGDTIYTAARYSAVWPEKIDEQDFRELTDSLLMYTFGSTDGGFRHAAESFMKQGLDSDAAHSEVPYTKAVEEEKANVFDVEASVSLLTPDVLVVEVYNYAYAYGSAHGYYTRRYLNYSVREHALLTADDMFTDSAAVLNLIRRNAADKYAPGDMVDASEIQSITDFRISDQDIVFVFQPYDVAPYVVGVVEVPVAQYDLLPYLTPIAKSTLGL